MHKKELDYKEIADHITTEDFAAAVRETQQFFSFLEQPTYPRIRDVPPMSPLAVLLLLSHNDEQITKNAKEAYNKMQATIASKPRPSRQKPEQEEVYNCWDLWQKRPELYPTETAFIRDMQEKMGIDRRETIRGWIKEFEKTRLAG